MDDPSDYEAARTPPVRSGGAKLKLSLNAFSFSGLLNDHLKDETRGLSLFDVLLFCAEQQLDAIDPTGYFFPGYPSVPADQYLNDFKRRAFELGLDISGTGVRNDFASPDEAKRAAGVRHAKEWIECAARMGAPIIRVFAGAEPAGYAWDTVAAWMVEDLKQCVEHGKRHGVIVGLQNHADFLKTASHVLRILDMVDSEWFGPIVDIGSLRGADPYDDIARLAPHAVSWQIKDRLFGKNSAARVDFGRVIRIIARAGYRGYLPIETLAATGEAYDPRGRVAQLVTEVREAIRSI